MATRDVPSKYFSLLRFKFQKRYIRFFGVLMWSSTIGQLIQLASASIADFYFNERFFFISGKTWLRLCNCSVGVTIVM